MAATQAAQAAAPVEDVRALRRGLKVIDYIASNGATSLAQLHRGTGLAKSTLRRLLATLEDENFIRRSLADGLFRSNISLPAQSQTAINPEHARIAAAARPVLEQLSRTSVWPSDVFVRSGYALTILDHNRSMTPLLVNRNQIGDRVDMITTGVGRAYLAFCPDVECEEILAHFEARRGVAAMQALRQALAETRKRGYGLRDATCTGATYSDPLLIDRLAAVALPVISDKKIICCINLLWPMEASSVVGPQDKIADMLREHACAIAANYERADRKPLMASADAGKPGQNQPGRNQSGRRPSKAELNTA